MFRPPTVNAGNVHPCTCQLTRPSMYACTLISSTYRNKCTRVHTQYLYYAFSLKSAFRHPPQPPFLHTSPNSGQSSFPLLHLSGLVRLSAASLKGCTTTLLSIKIHGRGKAPPMNIQHLPRTFRPPIKRWCGFSDCKLCT